MSIAAPLAASLILPGVGTALMGGLGGMASGGGVLASLLGGAGTAAAGTTAATAGTGILGALAGTGTGLASTIGGGLMTGAAKGIGHYAISEGMEDFGRSRGYGGDEDEIDLSEYGRFGKKSEKQAKEQIRGYRSAMEKGQVTSALAAGALGGIDKMGGFDKTKEMSADFGKKLSGQTKAGGMFNPGTVEGLGMEKAAGGTDLASNIIPKDSQPVQSLIDTPLTDGFTSPLATEGAPSLNLLTGDSTGNLLDQLIQPPDMTQGSSILNSLTQYPQEIMDYIANNPDMTQEELDELLASMGGQ